MGLGPTRPAEVGASSASSEAWPLSIKRSRRSGKEYAKKENKKLDMEIRFGMAACHERTSRIKMRTAEDSAADFL